MYQTRLLQIFTRYFSSPRSVSSRYLSSISSNTLKKEIKKRSPKVLKDPSIPRIAASSVAALIGRHTYTKREEAICDLAKKFSPESLAIVRSWESRLQRRSRHYLRAQLTRSLPRLNEIADDLTLAYREPDARSSTNSELAERAVEEVHALIQRQAPYLPVRTSREISRAVTQTAAQRHGVYQETASIDRYSEDSGVLVTERNAQRLLRNFFKAGDIIRPAYILSGRIDGYNEKENCIVEVKSRSSERDPFENGGGEPLEHDIIQLRCYLEMKEGAKRACLVEQFPGGVHLDRSQITTQSDRRRRTTFIERDEARWNTLHEEILQAMEDLQRFMKDPHFAEGIVRGATVPVTKDIYDDVRDESVSVIDNSSQIQDVYPTNIEEYWMSNEGFTIPPFTKH